MVALLPSLTQHAEEVQPPLRQDSYSTEIYETSCENGSRSSVYSGLSMGPHMAFFVLAALVLLILRAFHCSLSSSKRSTSDLGRRRLAGGKEGPGQDGEDQRGSVSCWNVGELLAPQGEADCSGIPLPSAQAAASAEAEAAAEGTKKRKQKRKTEKDSEDSSEKQAKTARVSSTETLQSTGKLSNLIEGPYPGPSTAPQASGSYPADLSTASTGIVSQPFSQPRAGTLPEDPSSSESAATSSQEGSLAFSEELSVEELIAGMLDAELLGFEEWFLDPSASLPLFLEQEDDLSQVPPDSQPSESGYDIPMPVTQDGSQQLLSEEVTHQLGQHKSPSPSSLLEGTSHTYFFPQPSPVLAAKGPRKVIQVAPSTSSAFPGAPQHSAHSLPPQMSPSSEAIPSTSGQSTASKSAVQFFITRHLPEPLTDEQCRAHPFYVLPTTEKGGTLRPFDILRAQGLQRTSFTRAVLSIADLLRKKHLATKDLQSLIDQAENLYIHAIKFMRVSIIAPHMAYAVVPWTRRFLTIHYLWCICEVVGPGMQKETWWDPFFSLIICDPPQWTDKAVEGTRAYLLQRMILALENFRQGQRPSAHLLVPILQQVFDSSDGISFLKNPEWDPWRQEDRRYTESLRRQEEESEDEEK